MSFLFSAQMMEILEILSRQQHNAQCTKKNTNPTLSLARALRFTMTTAGDDGPNGKIRLGVTFVEARVGLLCLDMIKVNDLPDRSGFFDKNMDPYVTLKLGGSKARTKVYKDKGSAFKFETSDETRRMVIWCGEGNYFDECTLSVWDSNTGIDTLLGQYVVNLMDLMTNRGQQMEDICRYDLSTGEGKKAKKKGHVTCVSSFHATGSLVVEVIEGKELRSSDVVGKNDPYVKVWMTGGKGGKKSDSKQRTQTVEGSNEPVWDAEVSERSERALMKTSIRILAMK